MEKLILFLCENYIWEHLRVLYTRIHEFSFSMTHKVLTYVEYRAVSRRSRVFQNIDPPAPSPPSECVLPPHQRRGYTLAGR
jgi:hypothetical protein